MDSPSIMEDVQAPIQVVEGATLRILIWMADMAWAPRLQIILKEIIWGNGTFKNREKLQNQQIILSYFLAFCVVSLFCVAWLSLVSSFVIISLRDLNRGSYMSACFIGFIKRVEEKR